MMTVMMMDVLMDRKTLIRRFRARHLWNYSKGLSHLYMLTGDSLRFMTLYTFIYTLLHCILKD